jgi:RimJ/RimL family protein N-acetyltransferase
MKKQNVVFLRGKKTILRPVEESDLPLLTKWINDREVTRFLKARMPQMYSGEKKWFDKLEGDKDNVVLVITTLEGKPIGVMGVHKIRWVDGVATTGAFIGEKSYWGKGYGTDAKMQVLNFCFNTLNLRKINSKVYSFNSRSLAYSKHCGYKQEGVLKSERYGDGKYHDVVLLALFRENWLPCWKKYQRGEKL